MAGKAGPRHPAAVRRWPALLLGAAFLAASWLSATAPEALAHGGPPLRIGVTAEPDQDALGRLLLAHLRDGVGYAVAWVSFPDETALAAAFAVGSADIAVRCLDAVPTRHPEPFLLPFSAGAPPACSRLGAGVTSRVLEDLRFAILGEEIRELFAALAAADLAAVREAKQRGGEREATAKARAIVSGKKLR